MSYYVYGTGIPYLQYLQAKSFVDDVSSTGRGISLEVSRRTLDVIASNEALARDNIRVLKGQHREHMAAIDASTDRISDGLDRLSEGVHASAERISDRLDRLSRDIDASAERITDTLDTGFDRLSLDLQAIESGLSELNATFHWGFAETIAGIGHMSDLLSELIKIAKTPVQTVAFNHFEIARDAFRQRLYRECLEELSKAISGDHASPGYKLEWRFHQLVGTIRLGFADMSPEDLQELQDLPQAEGSFLLAARYARTDYPKEAALAFLAAGWAAYCLGRMTEALTQTEQAFAIDPRLGEAFFQAAKVHMACGDVDAALPTLRQAIEIDRGYALKAAADGDFQKCDERLRQFLEALRQEKCQQALGRARMALDAVEKTFDALDLSREPSGEETDSDICWIREFVATAHQLPLVDLISGVPKLDASIAAVEGKLAALREAAQRTRATLAALQFWRDHSGKATDDADLAQLQECFARGSRQALPAVPAAIQGMDACIARLEAKAKNSRAFLTQSIGEKSYTQEYEVEEPYQEEVVIRPGGVFRKPVTEVQNKVRTVKKTQVVTLSEIRDEFRIMWGARGELLLSVDFCKIPAGQFMMGKKGAQRDVRLTRNFYMGKYPVTQGQWRAAASIPHGPVLSDGPSHFAGDPNLPVESVSWDDCQLFIEKLNHLAGRRIYRLPTEAEWEYASRGGCVSDYLWGETSSGFRSYAWCRENSEGATHPVGVLSPNGWGLHDVSGNVEEWCENFLADSVHELRRACRGGCWDDPWAFSSGVACRGGERCNIRSSRVGFRLARTCPS